MLLSTQKIYVNLQMARFAHALVRYEVRSALPGEGHLTIPSVVDNAPTSYVIINNAQLV